MEERDIRPLIESIKKRVDAHNLGRPGAYARWLWDNGKGRNTGLNEYGCADAANILYSIGEFPRDPAERAAWVETLRGMQDPVSGMYSEPTHHTIHTTAHCTAALELFDAAPAHPCTALEKYTTREGLYELLEREVDWKNPWPQSHKGAGILPCLCNTGMVGPEWKKWYFDWMWEHSDPETGFIYCGTPEDKTAPLYEFMAGGFHYMFNHEAERRPMRYPERIIDSCLKLMETGDGGQIRKCTFIDVDAVYTLTRAMRQTPYRFWEGKAALERYAEKYLTMLCSLDPERDESFNDLHMLFGAVCCLCELQSALPGKLLTDRPLRLVLDRRPFI